MVKFEIVKDINQVSPAKGWVEASTFVSNERNVNAQGQEVGKDYKGQKFVLLKKHEHYFLIWERLIRGCLGVLKFVPSLLGWVEFKSVQALFKKKKLTKRFGVLAVASKALKTDYADQTNNKKETTFKQPTSFNLDQSNLENRDLLNTAAPTNLATPLLVAPIIDKGDENIAQVLEDSIGFIEREEAEPLSQIQFFSPTDAAIEILQQGSKTVEVLRATFRQILNIASYSKIQDDYFMRFKGKLKNQILTNEEKRLTDQMIVLIDTVYVKMRKNEDIEDDLFKLNGFLKNPVKWTQNCGQGPTAFYSSREKRIFLDEYGSSRFDGQLKAWQRLSQSLPQRENNLSNLPDTCAITFTEVQGEVRESLNQIKASHLWNLTKNQEEIFSDFAFYNKDTDYITFEHVKKRAGYLENVEFYRTFEVEKHHLGDWKVCIFVENQDLEKAWDALRPVLFSIDSPVESGKIAKQNNAVAQIVLYTFEGPLDLRWEPLLQMIQDTLKDQHIQPLSLERKNQLFTTPEKYQLISGGQYAHYTLERYKIYEDGKELDGESKSLSLPNGTKVNYNYSDGFYLFHKSDYDQLPLDLKVNPEGIFNDFKQIQLN